MQNHWKNLALLEALALVALALFSFPLKPRKPKEAGKPPSLGMGQKKGGQEDNLLHAEPALGQKPEKTGRSLVPPSAGSPSKEMEGLGFVVVGRIWDENKKPIPRLREGYWTLKGPARKNYYPSSNGEGGYALMDLPPGHYSVHLKADGHVPKVFQVELRGQAQLLRRDFVLPLAWNLHVFAQSPQGTPLPEALKSFSHRQKPGSPLFLGSPYTLATKTLLPEWLPMTQREIPFISGAILSRRLRELRMGKRAYSYLGTLSLDRGEPAFVSVGLRNHILDCRRVLPGTKEVTFTIDPKNFLAGFGHLRCQVLDGASKSPLPNAAIFLETGRGTTNFHPKGSQALFDLQLSPGFYSMVFRAKGYEVLPLAFRVPPGATTDLGEILLEKPVQGTIQVIQPDGTPFMGMAYLTPLDPSMDNLPSPRAQTLLIGGKRGLRIRVQGPHRYRILIQSKRYFLSQVLDFRQGLPKILRLQPNRNERVVLKNQLPQNQAFILSLKDPAGESLGNWELNPHRTRSPHLPPGSYHLWIYDSKGQLHRKIPFEVKAHQQNQVTLR